VSDELTPDPLAELLANHDANQQAPAPLVPATPQFSSRREVRDATSASRRGKPQNAKAVRSSKASAPSGASPTAPSPTAPSGTAPSGKARRGKLSRKDRALVRRLAVTPRAAATVPKKRGKKQSPLLAALVLIVITAFVGSLALPAVVALAPSDASTIFATSAHGKQKFTAGATINAPTISRDSVTATSEAQLKAEQLNSAKLVSYAGSLASYPGARAPGDDYPWRTAGYGLSPLNYYYRQCVDFVAWRLNRDAGVTSAPWKWNWSSLTPNGGDASAWKAAWQTHGWKTSATPVVGAVAWFVGNHVAYVNSIKGSNVVIEEYNGTSSRSYAMRTIPIDTVGRFLYPPP
jgi:surface antigen